MYNRSKYYDELWYEDRKTCKIIDITLVAAKVIIRNDVFLGSHVCMSDNNGIDKDEEKSRLADETEIKENAGLGEGIMILPNIMNGKNAIIGAVALVTKDVEVNAVMMWISAK